MSRKSDAELRRDGIDQWLGTTRDEVARRIAAGDDMLHEGMLAKLVTGELTLPAGRPAKADRTQPTWADQVRADYSVMRKSGIPASDAFDQLAKKYSKRRESIENAVRRKAHK